MTLGDAKARYAQLLASAPGVEDPRVCEAFGAVPRERFVGRGPWQFLRGEDYTESGGTDPALIYDDVVVALMPGKRINNGQPTLHARCLSAARIRPGESVLHIGCGSGYYSAILAELVAPTGQVDAWDVEPTLVERATANVTPWRNVTVERRDALTAAIPKKDVIYACAGLAHPVRAWAEALSIGGRLVFPLTPGWDFGVMLLVTRTRTGFDAHVICRCSFIPCAGGAHPADERALRDALSTQDPGSVRSLHFGPAGPGNAWVAGDGWWLSGLTPHSIPSSDPQTAT